MKRFRLWGGGKEEELNRIESWLESALVAYEPDPGFVKNLRWRLVSYPKLAQNLVENHRQQIVFSILRIISGTIALAVGARLIVGLITSMGKLRHVHHKTTPVQS